MNLIVREDELFILPVPCISEFNGEILILFDPHVFWKILILYPGINSPVLWSTCKHLLSQIMSFVSQIVGNKLIDFLPPKAPNPSVSLNDIYNLLDLYLLST